MRPATRAYLTAVEGISVNRVMDIRSYLLIVQNLLSTERNELLLSKIDWIIVQKDLIIAQFLLPLLVEEDHPVVKEGSEEEAERADEAGDHALRPQLQVELIPDRYQSNASPSHLSTTTEPPHS